MKESSRLLVHIITLFMLSTAGVYFLATYLESTEDITEHAAQVEIILFSMVGITYIPLGIWMLKNRLNSRAPYVISIVISLALIGLYIAAKTVIMPIVGLEINVGIIDIISKVLQVAIVVTSVILLPQMKKNQKL